MIKEVLQTLGKSASNLFNKRLGTNLPDPAPRRGDFAALQAGILTGSAGEKKRERVRSLTPKQLQGLADNDPIIWAIRRARKNQIRQCRWDIIPDIDQDIKAVQDWFKKLRESLNVWGLILDMEVKNLREDVYGKFLSEVQHIMKASVDNSTKRSMLRWMQFQVIRYMTEEANANAEKVKELFNCPNAEQSTFGVFVERICDDLMIWDAAAIVKNPSATNSKVLAEMYTVPGHEVYKYINDDDTIPRPPEPAFVQVVNGQEVSEWDNEELVYICENMDYDHYGLSPTEVVAYLTAATIKSDEVNRKMVYQDAIPPLLINLGRKVTPEDRNRFMVEFESRLKQGKTMMALSGMDTKEFSLEKMGMTPKEMQLYEYLKWSVSVKSAVFQIAPQDIGFTMDLHRTTSEVQYRITKDRGLKSMLSTIELSLNREVVKTSWPFNDVKLSFLDVDKMDAAQQTDIDSKDLADGIISRNTRREHLGERPLEGGEKIFVDNPNGQGQIPLEMLDDIADDIMEAKEEMAEAPSEEGTDIAPEQVADKQGEVIGTEGKPKVSPQAEQPVPKSKEEKVVEVKGTPEKLKKVLQSIGDDVIVKYKMDFPNLPHSTLPDTMDEDEQISRVTGSNDPAPSVVAQIVVSMLVITFHYGGIFLAGAALSKIVDGLTKIGTRKARYIASLIRGMWRSRKSKIASKAAGKTSGKITSHFV